MSSASSVSWPLQTERRLYVRRKVEGLAYVDLGPNNGAILIDLGKGGLGFQSVAPVSLGHAFLSKFKLPGAIDFIETYAEVAWVNDSRRGGGLRFAELTAEARDRVAAWTSGALLAEVSPVSARNEAISVNGAAASESNETSALPAVGHPEPLTASSSKLKQEEPPDRPSASPVEAWLERTDVSERAPEPAVRHSSPEPASNPVSRPRPFAGESSNGVTSRVHTGLLAASAQESSAYSAPVELPAAPAAPIPALASSSVAFSSASAETREQEIPPPPR
jgi:hypothetical protein